MHSFLNSFWISSVMFDLMNSSLGGSFIQNRASISFAHSRLRKMNRISLFLFRLKITDLMVFEDVFYYGFCFF